MSQRALTLIDGNRRRVRLERTFPGKLQDAWDLWTTKEGFESWWGPAGFTVTVHRLELRPGGVLDYTMAAAGKEQIAFLERAGRPRATRTHFTFTEVVPTTRLAYSQRVDFVPDVPHYDVLHEVDLTAVPAGVQMVLTFDAMHDDRMTDLATRGWESAMEKLAAVLR